MSLLFLIPLAISIASAFVIFENSHDEIALLAASAASVSLILCLLFLPWQVQLLVLMFVLTITRRVSVPNQSKFR
jgi:hypothetical protein